MPWARQSSNKSRTRAKSGFVSRVDTDARLTLGAPVDDENDPRRRSTFSRASAATRVSRSRARIVRVPASWLSACSSESSLRQSTLVAGAEGAVCYGEIRHHRAVQVLDQQRRSSASAPPFRSPATVPGPLDSLIKFPSGRPIIEPWLGVCQRYICYSSSGHGPDGVAETTRRYYCLSGGYLHTREIKKRKQHLVG